MAIRKLQTLSATVKAESQAGCRFSELMNLPYFDAPRMLIIDPMHNLYLRSQNILLRNFIRKGLYFSGKVEMIQERVNTCIVPSGIGRIPVKIQSGFSNFTADQWKNWVLYFSILVLHDIVTGSVMECWQHFVLACRKLVTRTVSTDNVKLGDALLLQFCRRTEQLFGKESVTPNMHLHCHLADCMTDMDHFIVFGAMHLKDVMEYWDHYQTIIIQ